MATTRPQRLNGDKSTDSLDKSHSESANNDPEKYLKNELKSIENGNLQLYSCSINES